VPNSASRLHDLLAEVVEQKAQVAQVWAAVLGADVNTPDFARRHVEVLALLADTVAMLPLVPEASRRRYERYVPHWWTGVCGTTLHWGAGNAYSNELISAEHLDQLGAFGDLIEARTEGTSAAPTGEGLADLRARCEEWKTLLGEVIGLTAQTRAVLNAQIEHLLWLIDNVETFGPARVASEAQVVLSEAAMATKDVRDPEQRKTWRQMVSATAAAVALLTGAVNTYAVPTLEAGNSVIAQIDQIVDGTADILDGPDDPAPSK